MCTACGDTGYLPAYRQGLGTGTGPNDVLWADHIVMEPCPICRPWPPQPPIYIPDQKPYNET
jgi:hypothetical protein